MHPSSPIPYVRDAYEYLEIIPLHPRFHRRFDFFRLFYSFAPPLVLRTMLSFNFPPISPLYDYRWSFKLPAMSNILLLLVR